jgi:hypothetical protein
MQATTPNAGKSNGLRLKASLASTMFDVILGPDPTSSETKMSVRNGWWWLDLVFPSESLNQLITPCDGGKNEYQDNT